MQICGVNAESSFLPALELDAYNLYSDSWIEAGLQQIVLHDGRLLEQASDTGFWLPSVPNSVAGTRPYFQIRNMRTLEANDSALLSVHLVFDSSGGLFQRNVATAKVLFPV